MTIEPISLSIAIVSLITTLGLAIIQLFSNHDIDCTASKCCVLSINEDDNIKKISD